jgi:hypothetical protein
MASGDPMPNMPPAEALSPSKSTTLCATRRASTASPACSLANIAADIIAKTVIGSSSESNSAICSEAQTGSFAMAVGDRQRRSHSPPTAAAMSIECTTSANRTVTCLYSAGVLGTAVADPHSSQNFALGRNSAPHLMQANLAVMPAPPIPR